MSKTFIKNTKAASVAEFATLVSLVFTLALILYIGLNDMGRGFYQGGEKDPDMVSDRVVENCLTRTRANDTILPRQAKPFNCFKLDQGNDRITIDDGDNVIYPGHGRDVVIVRGGARDTQIVYEGGDDIYHFTGGRSTVDLRAFKRAQIDFDIIQKSVSTVLPGDMFNPEDRPAHDLLIRMIDGTITVADHFSNQPVDLIVFSDGRLSGEEIALAAVSDQITSINDQILGTDLLDLVAPGAGNDRLQLFEGDDIVTYSSGDDQYDPGPGKDILELPGLRSRDVDFKITSTGEDVRITVPGRGSIVLIDQAKYPPGGQRQQFATLKFEDETLRDSSILVRAVLDQGTPGGDTIIASKYSDTIRPGTGQNEIYPGSGSDLIIYGDGDDTIHPARDEANATDVLDLSKYLRQDLSFKITSDIDLSIGIPTGATIVIKEQIKNPPGRETPIEIFRLKNEELPDHVLRQLYFAPQKEK